MTSKQRSITRLLASPIARQTPIAVLVALAAVLSLAVPALVVSDAGALVGALVGAGVATALAALATWRTGLAGFANVVPAVDFVAIGLLRFATGTSASIFTSMLVLPVIWLAAQHGRRFIGYALAGTMIAILTPFVLSSEFSVSELFRLLFTLLVFGTVAVVVHELSRQAWRQVRIARDGEERVVREIDRAAAVQRSLLPQALCAVPGVSVAGTCLPAASVGGDFFDWYRTDRGIAITLGDVMGKGVGAGLIAAAVRAVVRSARTDGDPGVALRRASEGLGVDSVDQGTSVSFTTLFHARFEDGALRWADAGHGLTVVVRADGTAERLTTTDLPLGLGIDDEWDTTTTPLDPGDLVVCFSDGVLDLFGGGLDTIDRVVEIARASSEPAVVVETIAALAEASGHDDDVTVVALRREPQLVVPFTGPVTASTVPAVVAGR